MFQPRFQDIYLGKIVQVTAGLRVQVTAGLGFFSVFKSFIVIVKIVTPCFTGLAFLAGP